MTPQQAVTVPATFARALDALRAQFHPPKIALACSGGIDSMVLLRLAHAWAREHGIGLFAFHVHHGLSPHAGQWRDHCGQACAALGIGFDHRAVNIPKGKSGVEAAARKLRYAALGDMCRQHGVGLMLTAHHLDDQAETVLLQLLRGSGTAGLSGMDAANAAPDLLGNPDLVMARPLLTVSRADLEAWARAQGVEWVEDESNGDTRYARNALRHQVMPALAQAFPGFQQRFARSAAHAQSAQRLLAELARQDLAACLDVGWTGSPSTRSNGIDGPAAPIRRAGTPAAVERVDGKPVHPTEEPRPHAAPGDAGAGDHASLCIAPLRGMSLDRVYNLLRYWFSTRGLSMPSTAWLTEMVAQLLSARDDAQLLVTHPECHIRRHRDRLHITPKLADLDGMRDPDDEGIIEKFGALFAWAGQAQLAFPAYGGVLHFEPAAGQGFDAAWLRAQQLQIDFRQGGERLKLAPNRPTRSLKAHYQACGVPAWERPRLPVVTAGGDLIFAAGIGMDCRHFGDPAGPLFALRWEAGAVESAPERIIAEF